MAEYGEWNRKGATLSDVTAKKECGHACLPSRQVGYLVPLAGEVPDKCHQLHEHFTGPKWGGWCSYGIDEETADFIDEVLHHVPGGMTRLRLTAPGWATLGNPGYM